MENLIRDLLHLEDASLCRQLAAIAELQNLRKGETFLKIGDHQTKLSILVDGIVRFYYRDRNQKEYTMCFICKRGYPAMVDSYSKSILTGAHAVTEATLLNFPMEPGLSMIGHNPELVNLYIRILRKCMLFHAETAMILRGCTALQRYMWFLETFPDVDNLANGRHIASFLNISPETLSRLRAKQREDPQDFCRMFNSACNKNFDMVRADVDLDTPFEFLL